MIPEKKQVASLEIFEIDNIDNIDKLKLQIPAEFNKILKIIDLKSNI
jgi:hypothetical protein